MKNSNKKYNKVEIIEIERLSKNNTDLLLGFAVDSPKAEIQYDADSIPIYGWVLGKNSRAVNVKVSCCGEGVLAQTPVNNARPDVAKVYPQVPEARQSGFATTVSLVGMPSNSELVIEAILEDGSCISIAKVRQDNKPKGETIKILDAYVLKEPNNQNVLDIFKGEWSSRLPDNFALVTQPGTARLFEDPRVEWAEQIFGNFTNWKILELGPLEGGHSYMFQSKNANKIISIEANTRAFLKCLCIKEILNLDRVEFKLGDFMSFLENESSKYDMVFASGVLYHMEEPIRLLKLLSNVSDRIFIWTQYYEQGVILNRKELKHKFTPISSFEYDGVSYKYSTQSYKDALAWSGFCGGPKVVSKWLTRDSIIKALKQFGFTDMQINFEDLNHPNGPAFAICAKK